MKNFKILYLFIFIITLFLNSPSASAVIFSDVKEGNGNYLPINALYEMGIIQGYENGTYKPDQKVNRAEAIKMLILATELYNEEEVINYKVDKDPFIDTSASKWYAPFVAFAKDKEIISGYADKTFKPEQTVNLVEALKIYFESYDNLIYPALEMHNFADCNMNDWYGKYIAYANSRNMLDITSTNEIWPTREITRGYLADLIYKKKKFSEGYRFGKATFYGAAVQGNYTASGEIFDMYKYTAAHKTLPFGTVVEVTNLANGKSVEVRITDRGPYGPGRVIDLTTTAFDAIAWTGSGVINVQYKVLSMPENQYAS